MSTQPLTKMSNENISWEGKGGQGVELTNLTHPCVDCHEIVVWLYPHNSQTYGIGIYQMRCTAYKVAPDDGLI